MRRLKLWLFGYTLRVEDNKLIFSRGNKKVTYELRMHFPNPYTGEIEKPEQIKVTGEPEGLYIPGEMSQTLSTEYYDYDSPTKARAGVSLMLNFPDKSPLLLEYEDDVWKVGHYRLLSTK